MIRLAIRLAFAGGRTSAIAIAITTMAVAFGTAVLLFALSFEPALEARYGHSAWRNPDFNSVDWSAIESGHPGTRDLLLSSTEDRFDDLPVTRIDVAQLGIDAPLPPGLPAWPRSGEAYASPALQRLLGVTPPDQLGDRFGQVVGTLGEAGLRAPDELAVVVGLPPDELRGRGAAQVTALRTDSDLPQVSYLITILAAVAAAGALTPIGVFIATATRLTATSRERRLALLRLMGATTAQSGVLAAGEAACAMVPGAVLGVVLFLALRPAVASIQLDQADWFVDAVAPPLWQALAAVTAVPLLGVAAAVVAVRRAATSPLGHVRQVRPNRPSLLRLAPLVVAGGALQYGVSRLSDPAGRSSLMSLAVAVAFVGVVVGVAIAGPVFTWLLGRGLGRLSRGPAMLLASRRLTDAPSASFGAVSAVVLASFVAATFSIVLTYSATLASHQVSLSLRPGTVAASVGQRMLPEGSDRIQTLLRDLRALPGAASVLAYDEVNVGQASTDPYAPLPGDDDFPGIGGWLVDCRDFVATLDVTADCSSAGALAQPGFDPTTFHPVRVWQYPLSPDAQDNPTPLTVTLPAGLSVGSMGQRSGDYHGPTLIIDASLVPDGGAQFGISGIVALGDGSAAFNERARTLIDAAVPGSNVRTVDEIGSANTTVLEELARVVMIGTVATLLVAGCSLAVSLAAAVLDRRRPLALLRLTGMPVGRLRVAMLLEAMLPLLVTGLGSALLGLFAGQQILQAASGLPAPAPDLSVLAVFAGGLALALVVVLAAVPLVGPITSTEATRFE